MFAISTVERDTGIGRDRLRIWERRCGCPAPERNAKCERVYSAEQIRRLRHFRRLLDQGLRPGKVVPRSEEALDELVGTLPAALSSPQGIDIVAAVERPGGEAGGAFVQCLLRAWGDSGRC